MDETHKNMGTTLEHNDLRLGSILMKLKHNHRNVVYSTALNIGTVPDHHQHPHRQRFLLLAVDKLFID